MALSNMKPLAHNNSAGKDKKGGFLNPLFHRVNIYVELGPAARADVIVADGRSGDAGDILDLLFGGPVLLADGALLQLELHLVVRPADRPHAVPVLHADGAGGTGP